MGSWAASDFLIDLPSSSILSAATPGTSQPVTRTLDTTPRAGLWPGRVSDGAESGWRRQGRPLAGRGPMLSRGCRSPVGVRGGERERVKKRKLVVATDEKECRMGDQDEFRLQPRRMRGLTYRVVCGKEQSPLPQYTRPPG